MQSLKKLASQGSFSRSYWWIRSTKTKEQTKRKEDRRYRKLEIQHKRETEESTRLIAKDSRITPVHQMQKATSPTGSRWEGSGRLLQGDETDRKWMHANILRRDSHYWQRVWSLLSYKYKHIRYFFEKTVTPGKTKTCTERGESHYIIGRVGEREEQGNGGGSKGS